MCWSCVFIYNSSALFHGFLIWTSFWIFLLLMLLKLWFLKRNFKIRWKSEFPKNSISVLSQKIHKRQPQAPITLQMNKSWKIHRSLKTQSTAYSTWGGEEKEGRKFLSRLHFNFFSSLVHPFYILLFLCFVLSSRWTMKEDEEKDDD